MTQAETILDGQIRQDVHRTEGTELRRVVRQWDDSSVRSLIYIAWFAVVGVLPMADGAMLGLVRTRVLTRPVQTIHNENVTEISSRQPELG